MAQDDNPKIDLSFGRALTFWFQLGWISFGGPAGQIAIMHRELVERRRWISERRFLHALNYCMVLPGPEAQQLATYMGWLFHGARGGIAAGVLFVLPSLFILIGLSWIYMQYGTVPVVAAALYGMKPAVIAIIAFALFRLAQRVLVSPPMSVIAMLALLAIAMFGVSSPIVVVAAGAIGWLGFRYWPHRFSVSSATSEESEAIVYNAGALIHAAPRYRWLRTGVIATLLWALPLVLLGWAFGWQGTLTQMSWFFSKAALVTFGGAYAVLPYVQNAAVNEFQWLTAAQFIDGLALGETTPGPLIMIVAYIGFVGAWTHEVMGSALPFAGVLGAMTATFFTFLPSFVFVLVGAPVIEQTRDNLNFAVPLRAIGAAVVGVMASLGLFLARHVFWMPGASSIVEVDGYAIGIAVIAAVALIRLNVVWVILGCAALGMALQLWG
jgi:chromate transporter